jgi:hypothetical protein
LLIAFVQERQVEQPLAGIVHEIERQRARRRILPLVLDHEAQFTDVGSGMRPAPVFDQGADMAFIGKARHGVVRLRLKPARAMRPVAKDSNTGKRPPRSRPWTSAVMKTVLPARDRPVTPAGPWD